MCELQMFDATSKAEAEFVDARVNAATLAEHDEFDLASDVMHSVPAIEEKDNLRQIIKVDSQIFCLIESKMLSFHHMEKACNLMSGMAKLSPLSIHGAPSKEILDWYLWCNDFRMTIL